MPYNATRGICSLVLDLLLLGFHGWAFLFGSRLDLDALGPWLLSGPLWMGIFASFHSWAFPFGYLLDFGVFRPCLLSGPVGWVFLCVI